MPRQLKHILLTITFGIFASNLYAQTPTAEQIEQFKKLPAAQQQQLARQLGVDLSQIPGLSSQGNSTFQQNPQQGPFPRGTRFDEFGNPLDNQLQDDLSLLPEQDEEELTLYGLSLFENSPSTFSPVSDLPVPSNYLLGPGDELRLQIYGKENEDYSLIVGRDGSITVPKLGPFQVASMTFSEAKSFLANEIKNQVIGVEVSLTMGELRTMRVFVMGEAYQPGAYNVSSLSTITQALFASGGMTEIASLRNIQLKRAGKQIATLDLYDLLNSGDSSNDAQLQAGDVVFIPTLRKSVTVDGQVRRPAIYELKNEENISDVLKLAGGKLAEGFTDAISVKRYINGSQIQLTADLAAQNITVQDGDYITIPKVSPFVTNSVNLIGAVARPGKYQWRQGMRISDVLGNPQRDLLETADLTYVLILRDKNSNRDIEVLQTDLTQITMVASSQNVELKMNDRILVFSKIESEELGEVQIDEMAYSVEELEEKQQELWQKRIEDRLFWNSVGLYEEETEALADDESGAFQIEPLIKLTEAEKERVLEFKDTTFYSRKRMLAPVIAKLEEQAKFGEPLQLVEIAGEVKVPGVYPLAINTSVKDIIIAAAGLTESSYPLKSEITRTSISGRGVATVSHIDFVPQKILDGTATDRIRLLSKDRVNIFSIPSWQEELKVIVRGEVEFPGEYTIQRGEKLSDIVKRVGGLTSFGDPQAVVFTRDSLKIQEKENLRKLAEELRKQIASESLRRQSGAGAIVSYDEAKKLLRDLTQAEAVGRLVIDFDGLISGNDNLDVILEDGDSLFVPGRSQSVNVVGEVYVPTSHLFASGLTYEDYVSRSGGYRNLADIDNTYIIRANGSVDVLQSNDGFWFSDDRDVQAIRPGDTIVVPLDADNVDNMTLWTNATQILYQLAISVAAIGSL